MTFEHRSCLSQLLSNYKLIITALESKCFANVIYLDFAKAFDKVDHEILLKKMKKMNVSGDLAVLIHNFLSDRKQRVAVDGTLSEESPLISGIPQGSVLGLILFQNSISYINNITLQFRHLLTIPEFSNRSVASKIAIDCRKILTTFMNGPLLTICVSTHVNKKKIDILFPMVP